MITLRTNNRNVEKLLEYGDFERRDYLPTWITFGLCVREISLNADGFLRIWNGTDFVLFSDSNF